MKICIAQIDVIPGNPVENFNTMKTFISVEMDKDPSIDLIVFPEFAIPGYLIGDMWEERTFIDDCVSIGNDVINLAVSNGVYIAFGNVAVTNTRYSDGRISKYNAVFIASPSGNFIVNEGMRKCGINFIPKTLLPNYREFDDPRHFGSSIDLYNRSNIIDGDMDSWLFSPILITGVRIGFTICEDGWNDDYQINPMKQQALRGAKILINLSCSPFTLGKNNSRNRVFGNHANNLNVPVIYVNAVGVQNNGKNVFTFDGCSAVYHTNGKLITQLKMFSSDSIVIDSNSVANGKVIPITEIAEIYHSIHYAVNRFCAMSGIRRVVIGSSGGIDSAVAAAIYVNVLGRDNVILVNMPSKFNSRTTIGLSAALAENLGCRYLVIPIEDSVNLTKSQVNEVLAKRINDSSDEGVRLHLSDFHLENIQARDRSSRILAAVASAYDAVFTNNGNKTEITVGYCTLLGDHAGFLAAIGDLWKEQVYMLGKYINHIDGNGKELIPSGIFNIVPSAELSSEQDVDAGKGDPIIVWYHDRLFKSWVQHWNRATPEDILRWYIEGDLPEKLSFPKNEFGEYIDIPFTDLEDFVLDLERWWKQFKGMGVVKRVQSPPIVSIQKRAFGYDYRESLNCVYFTRNYYMLKREVLRDKSVDSALNMLGDVMWCAN